MILRPQLDTYLSLLPNNGASNNRGHDKGLPLWVHGRGDKLKVHFTAATICFVSGKNSTSAIISGGLECR